VHTGQIAPDPIVTPEQQAARQRDFKGDNLIERINLQPLTRESRRRDPVLAALASYLGRRHRVGESATLSLVQLIAVTHQGQRRLWGIASSQEPGEVTRCERQFAQVGRIAKEHSVFRMGTSMTTTVRHHTLR
jgi:hypothetical protein